MEQFVAEEVACKKKQMSVFTIKTAFISRIQLISSFWKNRFIWSIPNYKEQLKLKLEHSSKLPSNILLSPKQSIVFQSSIISLTNGYFIVTLKVFRCLAFYLIGHFKCEYIKNCKDQKISGKIPSFECVKSWLVDFFSRVAKSIMHFWRVTYTPRF